MTEMAIAKKRRLIFLILVILTALIIPVTVIIIRFNLIDQILAAPKSTKISFLAIAIILLIFFIFAKKLKVMIGEMEFSMWKVLFSGIFFMIPLTIGMVLLFVLIMVSTDLIYVFKWIYICMAITCFIWLPIWAHYNAEVLRLKRIGEVREGVRTS